MKLSVTERVPSAEHIDHILTFKGLNTPSVSGRAALTLRKDISLVSDPFQSANAVI